nr:hypothetical protein [Parachlamydiaceae bacterium]
MQPINNFREEAENEKITFTYKSNIPICDPYREELTVTMNQIIGGWAYRNCQEDYHVPQKGWIKGACSPLP